MNTMSQQEAAAKYESARKSAIASEQANQSIATQNKKWKLVFKLEDALKTFGAF